MKLSFFGKGCSLRNRPDGPIVGFPSRPSSVKSLVNKSSILSGSSNHELVAPNRFSTVARAAPAPSSDVSKSLAFADSLPISEVLPEIISYMNGPGRGVVVEAPPGAGKTTTIPLAILRCCSDLLGAPGQAQKRIFVLEPRRLAARNAATQMARLLGERVGDTVGYRTRFEKAVSYNTRVEVVTEGILLRRLQKDPGLEDAACIIFDEFHERNLDSDVSLALALDVMRNLRPDLKVVVMSATLGDDLATRLSTLMASEDGKAAPIVRSLGKSYPVTTHYVGPPAMQKDGLERQASSNHVPCSANGCSFAHGGAVEAGVLRALSDGPAGDVLVFLPGLAEIRRAQRLLEGSRGISGAKHVVHVLHGSLAMEDQDVALRPDPQGRTKIILSSPIAESSLTIPGVRSVVDAGQERRTRFDPDLGIDRLEVRAISRQSADQRRGRAGREAPGACFRLWSESAQASMMEATQPEIKRVDLSPLALELCAWGGSADGSDLDWVDAPSPDLLASSRSLLKDLGLLDTRGSVTQDGKIVRMLPCHPRLGHSILMGARWGRADLACIVAAMVGERDVLRGRPGTADIALRLEAIRDTTAPIASPSGDLLEVDRATARRVVTAAFQLRRQLASALKRAGSGGQGAEEEDGEGEGGVGVSDPDTMGDPLDGPLTDSKDSIDSDDVELALQQSAAKVSSSSSASAAALAASAAASINFADLADGAAAGLILATAFPDRIAQRREKASTGPSTGDRAAGTAYLLASGTGVRLTGGAMDPLSTSEYIAVASVSGEAKDGRNKAIYLAAELDLAKLQLLSPSVISETRAVFWAPGSKSVQARLRKQIGSLVLQEVPVEPLPEELAKGLLDGVRQMGGFSALSISPATRAFLKRAAWIKQKGQEMGNGANADLPDVSDGALDANMATWLGPAVQLAGVKSKAELAKMDIDGILRGLFSYEQKSRVDNLAPERWQVPSGSKILIDYSSGEPTVEVRMQEVFGLADGPRIYDGTVPLLLKLLSPSQRPVQTTRDLASFWASAYFQVKKELKGQYPKHYWPDDPLEAEAIRGVKRKPAPAAAATKAASGSPSASSGQTQGSGGKGSASGSAPAKAKGKKK